METGILEWQNEHRYSAYPLTKYLQLNDFIIDASFIQFDGYVPILVSGEVTGETVTLTFKIDKGTIIRNFVRPSITLGLGNKIYDDTNRYIGSIVFGEGLDSFIKGTNKKFKWNIPFAASTVVSVNSKAGVFTFENLYGNLSINTGDTPIQRSIFLNVDTNKVTWNAIGIPDLDTSFVPLKTINGVGPTNNAVTIEENEIIKIDPEINGITFRLVNSVLNDNIAPLVNYA